MSSANLVPETRDLTGDDAWAVLKRTGWSRIAMDATKRMRVADGFSHARSLAYLTSLVAIEGLIGTVGLASVLHKGGMSKMIDAIVRRTIPGPAGIELTTAVTQAHRVAAGHHYTALIFGAIGALVVATTAIGQLERGLNRIYGVEQDRPTLKKYGLALLFALSVGTIGAVAFVCLAFGRDLVVAINNDAFTSIWVVARWPLGVGLAAIAVTVLFRWLPRRRQPRLSWLVFGAGISVLLLGVATISLGLFYGATSSFGATYGPLAGVIALLVWSFLASIALFYGGAVAAQLEALRNGAPAPQDAEEVDESNSPSVSNRNQVPARHG
jgi:YihY family inner membrane protein